MNYVEKIVDGVSTYFDVNLATLSGAIDIIVVEQPSGTPSLPPLCPLSLFPPVSLSLSLIFRHDQESGHRLHFMSALAS